MGKSLYNISEELETLLNDIEESGGEITDEQLQQLEITQDNLREKVEGYCNAITILKSEEECAKNEKKRLNDRQNVKKNLIEKLKSALLKTVIKFGDFGKSGNKVLESENHKLFTKKTESLVVYEERFNRLGKYIKDYLIELRQQGILDTEEEIDLSGMIGAINAIAKSEEGDSFVPYTLQDACMINFRFEYVIDFNTLMRSNNIENITELMLSPRSVLNYEPVSFMKEALIADKVNKDSNYTIGKIDTNQSLTIK